MPVNVRRTLSLLNSSSHYEINLDLPITVADNARNGDKRNVTRNGQIVTVPLRPCDADMLRWLDSRIPACTPLTLHMIAMAAMRFYRAGHTTQFETEHRNDVMFIHLFQWDHIFSINSQGSLAHRPTTQSRRHTEALLNNPEMLAYGIGSLVAAQLFNITTDRFFFISGDSDKRPDFNARITWNEILRTGRTGLLAPGGQKVWLEVKARRNSSVNPRNRIPVEVLEDIQLKSNNIAGQYVGVVVSIPAPEVNDIGVTRILISDPGEPETVDDISQADILLRELFFLAYRIGLWGTARRILLWLQELAIKLTEAELDYLTDTASLQGRDDDRTLTRDFGGRRFIGRQFIRALQIATDYTRLRVPRADLEAILASGELGPSTFRGIDVEMVRIIDNGFKNPNDLEPLLSYGAPRSQTVSGQSLAGQSAFIEMAEPMNREAYMNVLDAIDTALSPRGAEGEGIDLADDPVGQIERDEAEDEAHGE